MGAMDWSFSRPGFRRNGITIALAAMVLSACGGVVLLTEGQAERGQTTAPDLAFAGVPDGATAASIEGRPPAVGVQFHGIWDSYDDSQRAATLDHLVEMGATWVRLDLSWAQLEPTGPRSFGKGDGTKLADGVIEMAHERGLKVLGMLWLTPPWASPPKGELSAPADPDDYARALARAANRWDGKVQAWEVWNEPNLDIYFRGANPETYTELLCAANRAVKAGDSSARVVFGGTVHNDLDWITRTYDAGVKGCFDIMATHPYGAPSNLPPSRGTDEVWELGAVAQIRDLMVDRGDRRKPMWATELGWSSHENTGLEEEWRLGVTEEEQAQFTVEALRILQEEHPYVKNVILYNDRERPESDPHQNGFGILREDNTPKPIFWSLREWLGA